MSKEWQILDKSEVGVEAINFDQKFVFGLGDETTGDGGTPLFIYVAQLGELPPNHSEIAAGVGIETTKSRGGVCYFVDGELEIVRSSYTLPGATKEEFELAKANGIILLNKASLT